MAAFGAGVVAQGLHAGKFVAEVAGVCGGKGGGRPNLAQAGGSDPSKIGEAVEFARGRFGELSRP